MSVKAWLLCVIGVFFTGWTSAEEPYKINLKLNLDISNPSKQRVSCEQNLKNLETYHAVVMEGKPFQLITDFTRNIDYIQCQHKDSSEVFVHNPKSNRSNITKKTATQNMSGVWNCSIHVFTNLNPPPEPRVTEDDSTFTKVVCSVRVRVRLIKDPHQMMIVNHLVQTTIVNLDLKQPDRTALYHYAEGEEVEVVCVNRENKCGDIEMKYEYAEQLDDIFKNAELKGSLGVGLHSILEAAHNGSEVICKCSGPDEDAVKLIFVLETEFKGPMTHCRINGLTARAIYENTNADVVHYKYDINTKNIEFGIDCIAVNDAKLSVQHMSGKCTVAAVRGTSIALRPSNIQDPCKFIINITNGTNFFVEKIEVTASVLPTTFNEDRYALKMNLSNYKLVMELFTFKQFLLLYYEYEDGDNVTVICSKIVKCTDPSPDLIGITFNSTELRNSANLKNTIKLNSASDKTTFECQMAQISQKPAGGMIDDADEFYRRVVVVFRKKRIFTTTTTTEATIIPDTETEAPSTTDSETRPTTTDTPGMAGNRYLIPVIAVVTCVTVAVCFIIILRKRRQNKPNGNGDPNYENLQCHSDTSIPSHPPQWSQPRAPEEVSYQVPADVRRDEDIYAQPVAEDPYATPIPKILRPGKGKKKTPEPTYAELSHPSGNNGPQFSKPNCSDYATVGELYSQVLPKAARTKDQKTYGNVFPDSRYVNSGTTEYVEPTYCQPHMK